MDTPKINNDVVISPTPKDPIQKCTGLWQQINKLFIKYEFVQMNKKKIFTDVSHNGTFIFRPKQCLIHEIRFKI